MEGGYLNGVGHHGIEKVGVQCMYGQQVVKVGSTDVTDSHRQTDCMLLEVHALLKE